MPELPINPLFNNQKIYKKMGNVINPFIFPSQPTMAYEAFVAPSDFNPDAQPVNIIKVFIDYVNVDKKYIYSFTSDIATLDLSESSGVNYRWAETIAGVEQIHDVASGTAFTAGSTKRYVIVNVSVTSAITVFVPTGAVWLYLYTKVSSIYTAQFNTYLKYIHAYKIDDILDIPSSAFDRGALEGILTLPKLSVLNSYSFYGQNYITKINFNSYIFTINVHTFLSCKGLTTIELPCNLIDLEGFSECSNIKSQIELPTSVRTVGYTAFNNCRLIGDLIIPEGVEVFGSNSFTFCPFGGILNLPSTIQSLGAYTFYGCTFTHTYIYASAAPTLGGQTFYSAGILHVKVGATGYNIAPWTSLFSTILYDL